MKYELWKKLKDAGFSQRDIRGDILCQCEGDWKKHQKHKNNPPEVYVPTLEELIGACEGQLATLESSGGDPSCYPWSAFSFSFRSGDAEKTGHGSTPEEAVANLWLAIKGQNQLNKGE